MPEYKVKGKSIVFWEVLIEAEDGDSAAEMTNDLLADSLVVELDLGPEVKADVTKQEDEVLRVDLVPKGPVS